MAREICRSYGASEFKKTRQPRADARGYKDAAPNGAKYMLAENIEIVAEIKFDHDFQD